MITVMKMSRAARLKWEHPKIICSSPTDGCGSWSGLAYDHWTGAEDSLHTESDYDHDLSQSKFENRFRDLQALVVLDWTQDHKVR